MSHGQSGLGQLSLTACAEWLWSGYGLRLPDLKIAMSEGGIGWVAMLVDRLPLIIAGAMPELPEAKRRRFVRDFGITPYDAEVLASTRPLAAYFEGVVAAGEDVDFHGGLRRAIAVDE